MAFLVSPGVQVQEQDLTNVIPAVSTSIGGYVGEFTWGPAEQIVTVTSENNMLSIFGKPDASRAQSFLTAASFLKYGQNLKVVRAVATNSSNAVNSGSSTVLIKNNDVFQPSTANFTFAAAYPGEYGNAITVAVVNSTSTTGSSSVTYADFIAPASNSGTFAASSQFAYSGSSMAADEIHVLIVDDDGRLSGTAGTILEKWTGLSVTSGSKKADGTNNYYRDVLNQYSSYVYAGTGSVSTTTSSGLVYALGATGGSSGSSGTISSGSNTTALAFLADAETVDVNLVFQGSDLGTTSLSATEQALQTLANTRKDCIAFISAPVEQVAQATSIASKLSAVTTKFSGATRDSYSVFDCTPIYVYNKYQDNYIWIPASGHMAGLCANADAVADAWWSPAGYNRGNLKDVTKLGFNPDQASRDTLYQASINPIVTFPGQGTLLYGDKTAQIKPSAFDHINVRRLFIVLEKAIATAAKYQLFEFNDQFTQAMFRNMTEPYLRDIKGRRGITDFQVMCDSSNNTPEIVDSNRFVASIYIKPARSINYMTLNFIATRTGVSFSEVAGASQNA